MFVNLWSLVLVIHVVGLPLAFGAATGGPGALDADARAWVGCVP